jgi:methyl-accepting chemotaxis protein
MEQRTWKRRNYFIKQDFQGRFILRFFLTILLSAVVFTIILSIFSAHTITITYRDSFLRIEKTPKALFYEILRAHGLYIFLIGLGISVLSLFLSHRIAGPLYRFERSVEEITKGNLTFRIRLRKKDEAQELANSMNRMIEELSSRISLIKGIAEELSIYIGEIREGSDDRQKESIHKISESLERLKKALSYFNTDRV